VKAEILNSIIQATTDILDGQLDCESERGQLRLQATAMTSDEVTTLVGVSGDLHGLVLLSTNEATAIDLASRMLGQTCHSFDQTAQNGVGQLGNAIAERAASVLSEVGYQATLTPPALVVGTGTLIATLDLHQLVLPFETRAGAIEIQVVLRPAAA
jgi:CheY-specific phosphatase CheX